MASGRVTDEERDKIIATLRETENVRETARRHGRGRSTISRIAIEEGVDAAGRPMTQKAATANLVDAKALRAELALGFLRDAKRIQDETFAPTVEKKAMVVSLGRGEGSQVEIVEIHRDGPTTAEKQQSMTARAIAVDKAMALERHDDTGESDVSDVVAFSEWMMGADEDAEAA